MTNTKVQKYRWDFKVNTGNKGMRAHPCEKINVRNEFGPMDMPFEDGTPEYCDMFIDLVRRFGERPSEISSTVYEWCRRDILENKNFRDQQVSRILIYGYNAFLIVNDYLLTVYHVAEKCCPDIKAWHITNSVPHPRFTDDLWMNIRKEYTMTQNIVLVNWTTPQQSVITEQEKAIWNLYYNVPEMGPCYPFFLNAVKIHVFPKLQAHTRIYLSMKLNNTTLSEEEIEARCFNKVVKMDAELERIFKSSSVVKCVKTFRGLPLWIKTKMPYSIDKYCEYPLNLWMASMGRGNPYPPDNYKKLIENALPALRELHREIIEKRFEEHEEHIKVINKYGETSISEATSYLHKEIMKLILPAKDKKQTIVNESNESNVTLKKEISNMKELTPLEAMLEKYNTEHKRVDFLSEIYSDNKHTEYIHPLSCEESTLKDTLSSLSERQLFGLYSFYVLNKTKRESGTALANARQSMRSQKIMTRIFGEGALYTPNLYAQKPRNYPLINTASVNVVEEESTFQNTTSDWWCARLAVDVGIPDKAETLYTKFDDLMSETELECIIEIYVDNVSIEEVASKLRFTNKMMARYLDKIYAKIREKI